MDQEVRMNKTLEILKGLDGKAVKWSVFQNNPEDGDEVLLRLVDRWAAKLSGFGFLEIGTCRGVSAAILARRGHVTTLDIRSYPETEAVLTALGAKEQVLRIVGPEEWARARFDDSDHFDACFIDGKHTFEAVMRDWEFARRHTRRVIFHDWHADTPEVIQAITELKERHPGYDWHHDGCFVAVEART